MTAGLDARLFRHLGSGAAWRSGELCAALGVSLTELEAAIERLQGMGLDIREAGGHVTLERPVPPLDADRIRGALPAVVQTRVGEVETVFSAGSTNDDVAAVEAPHACLLAEHQSRGRGRSGRQWVSPLGSSIYLSVKHTFTTDVRPSGCLAIGVGQALARRLQALGAPARVKWPNDIYVHGRKMAGILMESRTDSAGAWVVIVGVGVNYDLPDTVKLDPALRAVDFRGGAGNPDVDRNGLAAQAIAAIDEACFDYAEHGAEPIVARWPAWDAFPQASVQFTAPARQTGTGRAAGIDSAGRLLVETAEGTVVLAAGDVTYQALADADY